MTGSLGLWSILTTCPICMMYDICGLHWGGTLNCDSLHAQAEMQETLTDAISSLHLSANGWCTRKPTMNCANYSARTKGHKRSTSPGWMRSYVRSWNRRGFWRLSRVSITWWKTGLRTWTLLVPGYSILYIFFASIFVSSSTATHYRHISDWLFFSHSHSFRCTTTQCSVKSSCSAHVVWWPFKNGSGQRRTWLSSWTTSLILLMSETYGKHCCVVVVVGPYTRVARVLQVLLSYSYMALSQCMVV